MNKVSPLPKEQEKYSLTLLRSKQSDKAYAKNLGTGVVKLPYFNTYKELQADTFAELYELYSKLLSKPEATQILGIPTEHVKNQPLNVRRSKINFDYYSSEHAIDPVFYNYAIIDLDDPTLKLDLDFEDAYDQQTLSSSLIHKQSKSVLSQIFPDSPTPPHIVRLSSSFGTTADPVFKAHIIVPITQPVPVSTILVYLSQYAFIDTSMYRNCTQPVFTAGPIVPDETSMDPLGPLGFDIPRIYYFNEASPHVDATLFNTCVSAPPARRKDSSSYLPATELPDEKGVFNRAAKLSDEYSIHQWLVKHGYTPAPNNRYVSPTSTSNQPGLTIYPGGYVHDFHDNSPIQDLLKKYSRSSRSTLSAYDLHRLSHKDAGTLHKFKHQTDSLCAADPIFQSYWEDRIRNAISFVAESSTIPELEAIINALVEDIFIAKLSHGRKQGLFSQIVRLTPKVDGYKVNLGTLNKIYISLRQSLASELMEVHPDNKDYLNAKAFLDQTRIYRNNTGNFWIIEAMKGDRMELVNSTEEISRKTSRMVRDLSTDPTSWNLGKLQSTTQAILKTAMEEADDPDYTIPKAQDQIFAFSDSSRGVDILTGETLDINLDTFVLHTLPFTEAQYNNRGSGPNWHAFLDSTFKNTPDRITQVRDLYSYLLLPKRKTHLIYALVGLPRSGKSSIKNIIREILGESRYMETSPESLRDDFGLSRLTTETRLLIVNEFNASEMKRRNGFTQSAGKIVNTLKIISGRDEVIVREMRENPVAIRTDALPIILSNELPTISDRAFQDRLQIIKFDKMFAEEAQRDTGEFMSGLMSELPYIFHWAMEQCKDFKFHITEQGQRDKEEVTQVMDIHGGFFRRYLKADPTGWVSKKELRHFFGAYYYKRRGYAPDEPALSSRKFGVDKMKQSYPFVYVKRANTKLIEQTKASNIPGNLKDSLEPREWGFGGVTWDNLDDMIKELSEFSDYL